MAARGADACIVGTWGSVGNGHRRRLPPLLSFQQCAKVLCGASELLHRLNNSLVTQGTCSQSPPAAAVAVDVVGEHLAIYTGVADAAAFVVERFAIDTGVVDTAAVVVERFAIDAGVADTAAVVGERFATDAGVADGHADGRAAAHGPPAVVGLEDSTVCTLRRLPEPSCSRANHRGCLNRRWQRGWRSTRSHRSAYRRITCTEETWRNMRTYKSNKNVQTTFDPLSANLSPRANKSRSHENTRSSE